MCVCVFVFVERLHVKERNFAEGDISSHNVIWIGRREGWIVEHRLRGQILGQRATIINILPSTLHTPPPLSSS